MGVNAVEGEKPERPENAPEQREGAVAPDWRERAIVLVGMMGSGKTTIGKRLAARLGLPFVDADAAIEEAASMPISEIFARFGEPHFRDGERRVIARLMEGGRQVIATGGGAFCDEVTRGLILSQGFAIWLDADIRVLTGRVARRSHRPLLVGRDPEQVLRELAEVRNPFYAQAHMRIESRDVPQEHAVEHLLAKLHRRPA